MPVSDYTYNSRASFAHVLCTTSSATNAISTSAEEIFDNHASAVFASNVSDDITYAPSTGLFTFAKAGIYHVVLTLVTSQEAADQIQTTTMQLNTDGIIYTGAPFVDKDMDPSESTHQRIISIAAGDVLHLQTKTAGNIMGIAKGTSVIITEITSDAYGSMTVSTAGSNTPGTAEFNPYDTDLTGAPAFAASHKIASGVTFTLPLDGIAILSDGKYLIMVTNFFGNTGGTNGDLTMRLNEATDGILHTSIVKTHSTIAPMENTICVIEDLTATDVLTVTWQTTHGRVHAELGATFTVIKLQEGAAAAGTGRGLGGYGDLYACVVNKVATAAGSTEINPFDEATTAGGAGSADFDTRATNGITFTQSSGTFVVNEPGLYFIMHNAIILVAGATDVTMKILVNGVAQVTSDAVEVHITPDPLNITNSGFLELQRDDVITVLVDANDAVNITNNPGSTLTIFRYYGFFDTFDSHWVTGVAPALISDDLTINTFSQENLSAQYDRNTAQVPFKFGIRGAGTLRGRGTEPSVVKIGDKKA